MLENYLIDFREYTLKLIHSLENEKFDELEELLSCRQYLIEKINKLKYDRQEFKLICEKYEVLQFDKELNEKMAVRKLLIKSEINKMNSLKVASKNYNQKQNVDAVFLNKTI